MYGTRMLHPLREENIQGSIYGVAYGLNSHKKVLHLRSLILIKLEKKMLHATNIFENEETIQKCTVGVSMPTTDIVGGCLPLLYNI